MSYEYLTTSAVYAILLGVALTLTARPILGILQQEGYASAPFLKWFYRKGSELKRRYALLFLCGFLLTALFSIVFSFAGETVSTLLAMLVLVALCAIFVYAFRAALKVELKKTYRMMRLAVALFVVTALVAFGLETAVSALAIWADHPLAHTLLRAVPLSVMPIFLPLLAALANTVMHLYETPHTARFIAAAKSKLDASDALKVGITGSFAKTSVKHIAAQILSEKYRVIATPASYNTPVGIAKCVNEGGLDCDVFLAEMGARKRGDIAELCDMVCPSFAIVTGICPQHLETFGSLEAIEEEKGVLAARAKYAVVGKSAAKLCPEGGLLEGRDFDAQNIEISPEGTSFDLLLGGETHTVTTKLLGRHAAEDVALASALCFLLGMSAEEIAARIPQVEPIPHRLVRIVGASGVNVLDDAYNSNPAGAKNAVELLKTFAGKKYVVTPGLVELGELEARENGDLGADMAGLDAVILVGETLVLSVRRGYLDAGGEEGKLRVVPTLSAAQKILEEELGAGDAVLFLNDLPDKYL